MIAQDFHKGDLVETSWGERALVNSEPKNSDINLSIWFHLRKSYDPRSGFSSPDKLRLIRRMSKLQ